LSQPLDDRAKRIVSVAFTLAEEGGFEAVRLRDVARRADVALGTLYKRFPSKEAILVAALKQGTETFKEVVSSLEFSSGGADRRVEELLTLSVRALFNHPGFARAVLRAAASGRRELAAPIYAHQATMTSLLLSSLHPEEPDRSPSEADREAVELLQQITFASLIAWSNGLRTEDEVIANLQGAVRRLIGD
jgi:AcrR family transcriptional regulator